MKKSIGPNTIVFPTPVFVVGSYDKDNKPNAMVVAWGGICCSVPPCVAISLREATASYGNIVKRKAFTLSIPSEHHLKEVDYLGMVSGAKEDKLAAMKLTAVASDVVDAPCIQEFPLVLECSVIQTIKIGLHTQFIGEIKDIKADEHVLKDTKILDIEKIKPFSFNPATRTYYGTGKFLGDAFSVGKK